MINTTIFWSCDCYLQLQLLWYFVANYGKYAIHAQLGMCNATYEAKLN